MSVYDAAFVNSELSKNTSIFGLKLWVVIGIFVGAVFVLILFLLSLCITASRRRTTTQKGKLHRPINSELTPVVSKEIQEIVHHDTAQDHRPIVLQAVPEIQINMGKVEHRVVFSDKMPGASSGESRATSGAETGSLGNSGQLPEVSHLGWGRWYTLRELEAATNCLSDENVIGEGGYGIVYQGVLTDGTRVAVKNLLNNRGQAEKEFKVEVEAIGRVRHKNLVRLLGYCVEGAYRMLVYEYVDNGTLEQWLHGDVGDVSPLTWDIRMTIIVGTAKALAYLHEGLEPKVVHRDVKSSNVLLDRQWHPKLSDFGLAKLLNAERSYVTTSKKPMSILWEKSGTWRWLVRRTKESKPFFIGFATVCGVIPGIIGFCVMSATNTRSPELEAQLRKNARPESLMMGKVNKERLAEYLGELQRKENTNDRYVAALKGETLTRKPYQRIQPVPNPSDIEAKKEQK